MSPPKPPGDRDVDARDEAVAVDAEAAVDDLERAERAELDVAVDDDLDHERVRSRT